MEMAKKIHTIVIGLSLAALSACGAPEPGAPSPYKAVKVGKPYKVFGKYYTPAHQPNYEETGEASWYGPGFHGKKTANGEIYNSNDMTAAHKTLPLPSLVEVTNLKNDRKIVVRVNDRGPFAHGRIIDLSKAAAKKLDMIRSGVADVRVRYLPRATEAYLAERDNHDYESFARLEDMETTGGGGNLFSWMGVSDAQADETKAAPAGSVASYELQPIEGAKIEGKELPPLLVKQKPDPKALPTIPTSLNDTDVSEYTPPPPPAPRPVVATGGKYIQVGAYSNKSGAEGVAKKLAKLGDVVIAPVETAQNGVLYRVRLGPIAEQNTAVIRLQEAQSAGFAGAKIVQ